MRNKLQHGLIGLTALTSLAIASPVAIAAPAKKDAALDAALNSTVARIFATYNLEDKGKAIWDQPFYSAATRLLIKQWLRGAKKDEILPLSEVDWLCQCQDYDAAAFKVTKKQYKSLSPAKVRATVTMYLGFNESRTATLLLLMEKGRWEIDDVITPDLPKGIKSELRAVIAESKTQ
jgi:hypothetical protein